MTRQNRQLQAFIFLIAACAYPMGTNNTLSYCSLTSALAAQEQSRFTDGFVRANDRNRESGSPDDRIGATISISRTWLSPAAPLDEIVAR
jgi:hypothetical protein